MANTYTFRPLENPALRAIAWGRGVPSTTMAVMAALGHLERVDAVLHADPGWEHMGTQELGDFYSGWLNRHGVYTESIHTGDIRQQGAAEHIHIPFWTPDGGQLGRQCSRHFKIDPNKRRMRDMLGYHPTKAPHPPAQSIELWIGFTLEETSRLKPSRVQFITHRWPLIERRMTRQDCVSYLVEHGLPLPPPSSCVGCPYKDPARWQATTPDDFADAVAFDEQNRHNPLAERAGSHADNLYIYKPHYHGPIALADAPLDLDARRPVDERQLSIFSCEEGYCGV